MVAEVIVWKEEVIVWCGVRSEESKDCAPRCNTYTILPYATTQ